ncbi:MAG: MFS transporter [Deltaproteobacteria bacterium]|jgi:MFS family permease|nr:MFS transporter [Deltaproteobacteria bacterium]
MPLPTPALSPLREGEDRLPPLWTLTFLTFLSINFCIFLGFDMLLPTLSLYLDHQGCGKEQIGLIFASFTVSAVTMRLTAARLSRRFGATTVLRYGLSICFVGTFMFFLIPHPFFYATARLLHGAGFGLTSTLMVSMAAQVIPPQRIGEGLGYLGLGATVALAIGPLVGLKLATDYGYKLMFTTIALCYVAATFVSLTLPKLRLASDSKKDAFSLKDFLVVKAFPPASLIMLYGAAACAVTSYLAIYCQELGLPSAAGFFVISTIGTLTARLTSGRVYDRYGHFTVIPPSILLLVLSVLSIVLLPHPATLYISAVVYGLGMGSLFPSIQALTLSSVPPENRTIPTAIFFNAFDIGIGTGTLLMGLLAGHFGTFAVVYLAAPCFMLTLFALYLYYYLGRPAGPFTPVRKRR